MDRQLGSCACNSVSRAVEKSLLSKEVTSRFSLNDGGRPIHLRGSMKMNRNGSAKDKSRIQLLASTSPQERRMRNRRIAICVLLLVGSFLALVAVSTLPDE